MKKKIILSLVIVIVLLWVGQRLLSTPPQQIQSATAKIPSNGQKYANDTITIDGFFEGNEPFWNIEIKDNHFVLHCMNDTVTDTLRLSKKQTHTDIWAFHSTYIFGIIRKSYGTCKLDITEKENPSHEIYFSYKNTTYMGCGWIKYP